MLGRQQIAGAPTALHELFKNAYDAYAQRVEVDFFRKSDLLVLRDDGTGMSEQDFVSRWLTLGTESKLVYEGKVGTEPPKGFPDRPIMGEKGIGRLAISTMGPIVFIATRSDKIPDQITTSLVPWRVFELPSIDLDDFEVPVERVTDDCILNDDVVPFMREFCLNGIDALESKVPEAARLNIREQIAAFDIPLRQLLALGDGPTVLDGHTGTIFIISPVAENLRADIDEVSESGATNLQKMLLGFSNTMTPKSEVPIKTAFRDHLEDGAVYDRIRDEEFFNPEEFEMADHQVRGRFDEYGNFSGTIKIYDSDPIDVSLMLYRDGRKRACGPFDFDFAYLQGQQRASTLAPSLYEPLKVKLNQIGGIYIYRDGIRVLPYGDVENDFLSIERRRNKSASYYFFSYRRIFGAISLTNDENSSLHEKAGREGFQNNRAFREFRDQLIEFFVQMAEKFFRSDGAHADEFLSRRNALEKEHNKMERRAKLVSVKRRTFSAELEAVTDKIDNEKYLDIFEGVTKSVKEKLSKITGSDAQDKAERILNLESTVLDRLEAARKELVVSRPRGVGLTKTLAPKWELYQRNMSSKVSKAYDDTRTQIDKTIGDLARQARISLDASKRLEAAVDAAMDGTDKSVRKDIHGTKKALDETEKFVDAELTKARSLLSTTRNDVDRAILEFSAGDSSADFASTRSQIETHIIEMSDKLESKLKTIRIRLERVSQLDGEAEIDSDDTISAMETELEVIREEYAQAVELAQLGMAVSIVQHEFAANVKEVRRSLKAMQNWAVKHDRLYGLYANIRDGFDHLDNYLSLFTPLDRRLRRRKTEITGRGIEEFVRNLFGERFDRHDVDFVVTDEAKEAKFTSYASVILPVFVNLVDNSIYWLTRKDGHRKITLHATDRGIELTDDGPGISELTREAIFEFNFSTKEGGRGMGLYIARTTLRREGLDIYLDEDFAEGARFVVETFEREKSE